MGKKHEEKRSPLRQQPLRNPGQSTGDRLNNMIFEKVGIWATIAAFALFLTTIEWIRWCFNVSPQPIIFSVIAVAIIIFAIWRIRKVPKSAKPLALGRDGEIVVGQLLETLHRDGYRVFHDIPGERGNIDHVIVGPGGIFVIETKTNSKPIGRDSKVKYDGHCLKVDGFIPDRDPIAQVKAAVEQINQILHQFTGKQYPIRPVVVYAGWYIDRPKAFDVWVMNENLLVKWVKKAYSKLSDEDIQKATGSLEMYIRNYNQ